MLTMKIEQKQFGRKSLSYCWQKCKLWLLLKGNSSLSSRLSNIFLVVCRGGIARVDFLFQRAAQFFTIIITSIYLVLSKAEWNCSRASQMSLTSITGWDIWYYQGTDTQGILWTLISCQKNDMLLCVAPLITTTIREKLKRRYYSIFFSERRVHLFQLISLSRSPNDNQKETENMIKLELFLIVLWYYVCSACPFWFWTRHTTDWSKDYWPRLPDNSDLYWRSKVSFQSINLYLFCPNEILQETN